MCMDDHRIHSRSQSGRVRPVRANDGRTRAELEARRVSDPDRVRRVEPEAEETMPRPAAVTAATRAGVGRRTGTPEKAVSVASGQTNGLSSSLAFTTVQGLELVNPNAAADRVKEANNKWFNAHSGFLSAAPK